MYLDLVDARCWFTFNIDIISRDKCYPFPLLAIHHLPVEYWAYRKSHRKSHWNAIKCKYTQMEGYSASAIEQSLSTIKFGMMTNANLHKSTEGQLVDTPEQPKHSKFEIRLAKNKSRLHRINSVKKNAIRRSSSSFLCTHQIHPTYRNRVNQFGLAESYIVNRNLFCVRINRWIWTKQNK